MTNAARPAAKPKARPRAKRVYAASRFAAGNRKKPPARGGGSAVAKTGAQARFPFKMVSSDIPRNVSIFTALDVHAWNPFDERIASFNSGCLPMPFSMGTATYVRSASELYRPTGTGSETDFIVMMYTASSAKCWYFYHNGTCNEMRHAVLDATPPLMCRPGRVGLKLMNIGKATDICGLVSVYQSTDPVALEMTTSSSGQITTETITLLKQLMTDSGKVTKYTGADFVNGKEFWLKPASSQQYLEWQQYRNLNDTPVSESLVLGFGLQRCPCSVCVIGLHDASTVQKYHIQSVTEDWCRFAAPSLGSSMAKAIPDAPIDEFARASRDTLATG